MVSTAYMDEAERFDWLVAMFAGRVLATGTPKELMARTGTDLLDAAFIALMPEEQRQGHVDVVIPPRTGAASHEVVIEAKGLTQRFGAFTAVDHVSFRITKGEIFGFLGSNGCGKSTTMKMLTGLLPPTEGTATLFGQKMDANDMELRLRVGYMSQAFSLYSELSVRQNLELHARLYRLPPDRIESRVAEAAERFDLTGVMDALPDALPLGMRQRLQLAVAMIHNPPTLLLDEPTSGVDPIERDKFWQILVDLSRKDDVTIFVSTHFMNEAMRCDRISLMNAGKVLVTDTPQNIIAMRHAKTLEEAFIEFLEDATGQRLGQKHAHLAAAKAGERQQAPATGGWFSPRRMGAYMMRETLELRRDPLRLTMALFGSLILLFVMGYGINLDVDNLSFAVLDRDQTTVSQNYILNIAGSRYFIEHPPITSNAELDHRVETGEVSLAIEIPPNFARDIAHGRDVKIGMYVDGAMPIRAETIRGYAALLHGQWLTQQVSKLFGNQTLLGQTQIEVRYRYNPGFESLIAMVPAVIPLLLLVIPANLVRTSVDVAASKQKIPLRHRELLRRLADQQLAVRRHGVGLGIDCDLRRRAVVDHVLLAQTPAGVLDRDEALLHFQLPRQAARHGGLRHEGQRRSRPCASVCPEHVSVGTGCGVGMEALGPPIAAAAMAPPLITRSGLTPKKAGVHKTRSASLPFSIEPMCFDTPCAMAGLMVYFAT